MKANLNIILPSFIAGIVIMSLVAFKNDTKDNNYEYKQFSTVESIIPAGLGRSRIIETSNDGQFTEKELKNFYSAVGINFNNIANNDQVIVGRLNDYTSQGWELVEINTGVQSPAIGANGSHGEGIYMTRYLFRRLKQ